MKSNFSDLEIILFKKIYENTFIEKSPKFFHEIIKGYFDKSIGFHLESTEIVDETVVKEIKVIFKIFNGLDVHNYNDRNVIIHQLQDITSKLIIIIETIDFLIEHKFIYCYEAKHFVEAHDYLFCEDIREINENNKQIIEPLRVKQLASELKFYSNKLFFITNKFYEFVQNDFKTANDFKIEEEEKARNNEIDSLKRGLKLTRITLIWTVIIGTLTLISSIGFGIISCNSQNEQIRIQNEQLRDSSIKKIKLVE